MKKKWSSATDLINLVTVTTFPQRKTYQLVPLWALVNSYETLPLKYKTKRFEVLQIKGCGDPNGRRGEEKIRNRERINPGVFV
jgi:hypothetical protein